MTPTRQEIKAAIEWCLYVCKEIDDSNSGAAAKLSSTDVTAVLRAMLETFDEREDFMEAAMRASAHVSKYFPDDKSRVGAEEGDLLILAQVDAYRRLVEKERK